jgi:hypothetical protein
MPVVDTRYTEKQRTEAQSRKSYEITGMETGVYRCMERTRI